VIGSCIVSALRASIIVGCKLAKWWGGGEKGGERREAGCKLTASLDTGAKKLCEREISGPVNS